MAPGIGPAVVRIGPAHLPSLIGIIHGRRAGPGHLDGDSFPENTFVDTGTGSTGAEGRVAADHPVGTGQEAGMVMVGQFIHGTDEGRVFETRHFILHDTEEGGTVLVQVIPVGIGVFFHAGKEPGNRLHKGIIVHDRIPFTAIQPGGRISIVFRDDQRIGVDRLDPFPESLPELMVKL